jgi:hypothetical protein
MSSTTEVRRAAAIKAFERMKAAGFAPETEPKFLAWLDAWIAEDLTMADVRLLYGSLIDERRESRRERRANPNSIDDDASTSEDYSAIALDALMDELEAPDVEPKIPDHHATDSGNPSSVDERLPLGTPASRA